MRIQQGFEITFVQTDMLELLLTRSDTVKKIANGDFDCGSCGLSFGAGTNRFPILDGQMPLGDGKVLQTYVCQHCADLPRKKLFANVVDLMKQAGVEVIDHFEMPTGGPEAG